MEMELATFGLAGALIIVLAYNTFNTVNTVIHNITVILL